MSTAQKATRFQALICDCDGVLIDSEAVAARVLVRELEARWPGADVTPVLMPLLGQRIERVLSGAGTALERSLTAADVDAIRTVAEAEAREAPLFPGVVAALDAVMLTKACAASACIAPTSSRDPSPHPMSISRRRRAWASCPQFASSWKTA